MAGIIMGNIAAAGIVSLTLSPASVAANTTAEQTFTMPGAKLGDFVDASKPTAQAGLGIVNSRISADGTIAITFSNNTASPIVPTASERYLVRYARPDATITGVVS